MSVVAGILVCNQYREMLAFVTKSPARLPQGDRELPGVKDATASTHWHREYALSPEVLPCRISFTLSQPYIAVLRLRSIYFWWTHPYAVSHQSKWHEVDRYIRNPCTYKPSTLHVWRVPALYSSSIPVWCWCNRRLAVRIVSWLAAVLLH